MARNVEIKARIQSLEALLPTVAALADSGPATIRQEDTFFQCPSGRFWGSNRDLRFIGSTKMPTELASDHHSAKKAAVPQPTRPLLASSVLHSHEINHLVSRSPRLPHSGSASEQA